MWPFKFKNATEHPERLQRFMRELESMDWSERPTTLNGVYAALDELIYQEVLYYYKKRKRGGMVSGWTRGFALLLGTAGIMIPLLTTANHNLFKDISSYGYPCFALAAACLACNKMFGATDGHIRYVKVQLELERLMTNSRLEWIQWRVCHAESCNPDGVAGAFEILRQLALNASQVTQDETLSWGAITLQNLNAYEAELSKKSGAGKL